MEILEIAATGFRFTVRPRPLIITEIDQIETWDNNRPIKLDLSEKSLQSRMQVDCSSAARSSDNRDETKRRLSPLARRFYRSYDANCRNCFPLFTHPINHLIIQYAELAFSRVLLKYSICWWRFPSWLGRKWISNEAFERERKCRRNFGSSQAFNSSCQLPSSRVVGAGEEEEAEANAIFFRRVTNSVGN